MCTLPLSYVPNAITFWNTTFTPPNSNGTTYERAAQQRNYKLWGLRYFFSHETAGPEQRSPPVEFTQYILRRWAISQRECPGFTLKLDGDVLNAWNKLIAALASPRDIESIAVHEASNAQPSPFRWTFIKYFFRKVMHNLRNESGRYKYCENYAGIFPFEVVHEMPVNYDIDILKRFDNKFFTDIQKFLDEHFEDAEAFKIVPLLLRNIAHFQATHRNDLEKEYMRAFPRLRKFGIETWFQRFYDHYKIVRREFDEVEVNFDAYNYKYFDRLPFSNFEDLSDLLSQFCYERDRVAYTRRFEKYLFFFAHALKEEPTNAVHFIDDVLFECLKCLYRFKTSRQDAVDLANDIAKLALVHLRTKPAEQTRSCDDAESYLIQPKVLQNIKNYVEQIPNIGTAQFDVEYKTDYLHGRMLLRTNDTCYGLLYSHKNPLTADDFYDSILCSLLPPDAEQIEKIIIYNAYHGVEHHWATPADKETVRNFVRFSNRYDYHEDSAAETKESFLMKNLDHYYKDRFSS